MPVTQPGGQLLIQAVQVMSPDDQMLNQFAKNIARGTTDPGYRVYNLSYLSS